MRWYSVKSYWPPTCQYVFIRAINNKVTDPLYDRHFIAMVENLKDVRKLTSWEMANGQVFDIDLSIYLVTHFAIIEPVEIEE